MSHSALPHDPLQPIDSAEQTGIVSTSAEPTPVPASYPKQWAQDDPSLPAPHYALFHMDTAEAQEALAAHRFKALTALSTYLHEQLGVPDTHLQHLAHPQIVADYLLTKRSLPRLIHLQPGTSVVTDLELQLASDELEHKAWLAQLHPTVRQRFEREFTHFAAPFYVFLDPAHMDMRAWWNGPWYWLVTNRTGYARMLVAELGAMDASCRMQPVAAPPPRRVAGRKRAAGAEAGVVPPLPPTTAPQTAPEPGVAGLAYRRWVAACAEYREQVREARMRLGSARVAEAQERALWMQKAAEAFERESAAAGVRRDAEAELGALLQNGAPDWAAWRELHGT